MPNDPFSNDLSRFIWASKYRYIDGTTLYDRTIEDTWRRVAAAIAAPEGRATPQWETRFYDLLEDFRFLPGGRVLAGAGTSRRVTLFNCFVMGVVEDSLDGIFEGLKEGALTMQQGGGVGYDFSALRPRGTAASHAGTQSSGPVSFMRIWDAMCSTLLSTGSRRGAMMATLRCDHPDSEEFVDAKRYTHELRNFNLSVLISDDFMAAVRQDADWPLVFPQSGDEHTDQRLRRAWSGYEREVPCGVFRHVRARDLWQRIMRATYDTAEPGVLFIDRINADNNLYYCERITATNPCGEIPLPPYGACNLGSVNLTRFALAPFTERRGFDWQGFEETIRLGVRFMDNVTSVSCFPLEAQRERALATRRIGLGVTGVADALLMLGMRYGDEDAQRFVAKLFETLRDTAYRVSCDLAEEKGAFPDLDTKRYLSGRYVERLPEDIRSRIAAAGIRNSHLLAMAPTGTVSLLANNVSSGLEPVFDFQYHRNIRQPDGTVAQIAVTDHAWSEWAKQGSETKPDHFVTAHELEPETHLAMQATIQPFVDNAVSKTVNVPRDFPFEKFNSLYEMAYSQGCKGCTTFRPNPISGEVLIGSDTQPDTVHCCTIDREGA